MNIEHLKEVRDQVRNADLSQVSARELVFVDGSHINKIDLAELSQHAVLPGDPNPAERVGDVVTYGEWTTLDKLYDGMLFEAKSGQRYTRLRWQNSGIMCHPLGKDQTCVNNARLEVREIILPPSRAVEPEPLSLDERAWEFLERISCVLAGRDYADASRLLAERQKQKEQSA